jgi:hypothetical protein
MNPERPVCTCIRQPNRFGVLIVKVFDPFCQLALHKWAGNYRGPLPAYEPRP